ncbi:MAG: FgL, flagellar protein [Angelakisella sp.]
MRITQSMMSRGYINRMNKNLQNLSKSNNRMASQMKYTRISDNTAEVSRAFVVREQLERNEQYTTNIKNAEGILASTESNLQMLNSSLNNVTDRLLQANTGTMPDNERKLIAREIKGLQEQALQISNAKYGEQYLFSGSGKGKEAPFSVDAGGELQYNGYPVDSLFPHPTTGKPSVKTVVDPADPTKDVYTEINYNKDIYIDIGLGLNVSGSGVDAKLDPKSAMKISTSGVEALGFGMGTDGLPNNLYSLLGKIVNDMESGNVTEMGKDIDHIKHTSDTLLLSITDVGTRAAFLEDTWNRMDSDSIILKTAQQKLESAPLEEEAIYNKSFETSWMITLQLGSKLIPPSIFDFIR